jgi:hypothetical protein
MILPSEISDPRLGAHSEVRALDQAIKARRALGIEVNRFDIKDFQLHNRNLSKVDDTGIPLMKNRCENCSYITNGINVIGHN